MTVSLVKGQKVNLTKEAGGSLHKLVIGLGWDAKDSNVAGANFDLDASCFAVRNVGGSERVLSDNHFVFWGNLSSPEQAIVHQGDNLTGTGEGDDEQIVIDTSKVPDDVEKIVVAVTIYDAANRGQNFGMVNNAFVRAEADGVELSKYELDFDAALASCVVFGELVKRSGDWHFSANSSEFPGGLEGLCNKYGITVG